MGFFDSIRAAGRTPVTIHTYASIVHRFLSWCVEADLLPEDPLAGFTVAPPTSPGKPPGLRGSSSSTVIPCFDGLAWSAQSPCTHVSVPETMIDRAHDISAVIDALPTWFGDRVDISHVGVMGASRGSVAAFVAAGGSTTWGIPAEPRVKAIMGMTIAFPSITFGANLHDVTVPALLVDGTLDMASPSAAVQAYFNMLGSTDKQIVLIENATHRHFGSGLCAITQSAGAIAAANPRAILDLHTIRGIVTFPPLGVAMDFCGFETFTTPSDIRPLVFQLTGFNVTPTNVPRTGLDSTQVNEKVTELAAAFFGRVFELDSNNSQ